MSLLFRFPPEMEFFAKKIVSRGTWYFLKLMLLMAPYCTSLAFHQHGSSSPTMSALGLNNKHLLVGARSLSLLYLHASHGMSPALGLTFGHTLPQPLAHFCSAITVLVSSSRKGNGYT